MEKRILPLKYFSFTLMMILGLFFDDVNSSRILILGALFLGLFLIGGLRDYFNKHIESTYLIDGILVLLIELNSRYVVNYFYHLFYIFILIELFIILKKNAVRISVFITMVSMYKFIFLIKERFSLGTISQVLFLLLINVVIISYGILNNRYRKEKEEKEKLYKELENMTREQERLRIARDIHDTLGHEMTALIMQLEMASRLMDKDFEKTREIIDSAKVGAREGLTKIRGVVEAIREDDVNYNKLINGLIEDFRAKTNLDIKYEYNIDFNKNGVGECLYRLVQESITNVSRHSNADSIEIRIIQNIDNIKFWIKDNGSKKPVMEKGYGLKGLSERIVDKKGKMKIYYNEGFIIEGFIPIGGNHD
ncbi:MAG: histidine kinase [Bacillota bacterium]|nr:histidine kinase [Bacillota bacterium]